MDIRKIKSGEKIIERKIVKEMKQSESVFLRLARAIGQGAVRFVLLILDSIFVVREKISAWLFNWKIKSENPTLSVGDMRVPIEEKTESIKKGEAKIDCRDFSDMSEAATCGMKGKKLQASTWEKNKVSFMRFFSKTKNELKDFFKNLGEKFGKKNVSAELDCRDFSNLTAKTSCQTRVPGQKMTKVERVQSLASHGLVWFLAFMAKTTQTVKNFEWDEFVAKAKKFKLADVQDWINQNHLFLKRFSAVAIVLVIVLVGFVRNQFFTQGATFGWIQTGWSTANTGSTANHTANKEGWTTFYSKDANVAVVGSVPDNTLQIASITAAPMVATLDADFNSFTPTNTYVTGNAIYAKKPIGFSCTAGGECLPGGCIGSVCVWDCSNAAMPCGQTCAYNGDAYTTVSISTSPSQCWFAENLRTTKKPDGTTDITALAYCNPSGCGSPWGRLYNWNTTMNGLTTSTATGAKIQGICPSGWHIPSDYASSATDEWQKLVDYLGGGAIAGGHLKQAGTSNWTTPNTGADNTIGFAGYPAGYWETGAFYGRNTEANFWTSFGLDNFGNSTLAYERALNYSGANMNSSVAGQKARGMSVRCVRD